MRTDPKTLKETEKSTRPIEVECRLGDCIYHEGSPPGYEDRCNCSHPHKQKFIHEHKCPLYQLDWVKKMNLISKSR